MTVIIFIIVLAVLIFVHELGHFLFARLCGIRVDEFALGFGPNLVSWKRGETKYGINAIPFGGYVKIFGENPDDENTHGPDKHRSFVNKNRFQQALVLVAGVIFNFLFAWLLYTIVFTSGVTATTDGFGQYASRFHNQRIMISLVDPGSPAEKAGLSVGDTIQHVDLAGSGKLAAVTVTEIQDLISSSKGAPVTVTYIHDKTATTTTLTAVTGLVADKYAIGIAMDDVVDLRLPFFAAIYEGAHYTLVMIENTAIGLYSFVASIFHGTANLSEVSGPVGIAGIVGDAAAMGFTYLLMVTALISLNLGVINLIPFPALDGGRVLFVALEGIFRRRIPAKFTNTVNIIGFALLMLLMVVVTYKDIAKLIHG